MVGDPCIVSLQPTIFNNITSMLEELDAADNAITVQRISAECNLITNRRRDNLPRNTTKKKFYQRKPVTSNSSSGQRKSFCRICYHAGASPAAYQSHSISSCKFLTQADKSGSKVNSRDGIFIFRRNSAASRTVRCTWMGYGGK